MKKEDNQRRIKNVLFVGMTDYDFSKDNPTLKKKFEAFSEGFNSYVLARGKGWHIYKYNTNFYLIPRFLGKINMPIWLILAFFRGLVIIPTKHIDTIIVQSPALEGFVGTLLKILTRRELIVEAHGDWINSYFYYFSIPFEKQFKKVFIKLGRFSLKRADKVRVISTYIHMLAEKYAAPVTFYEFAAFTDIDIFKAEKNLSWEKRIVYVGGLYRLKGVQFLIEAFGKLHRDFPGYKLIIVGDGPYKQELESFTKKLKKEDYNDVVFTGRKELSEVKDIMKNCNVVVLPSLSEGLGRVLIEAAMLGKPIIGSNIDGIPDLIKEGINGYLFERGNVKDLEQKIRKIIENPELAEKMGNAGREYMIQKYSTEKYFDSFIKMIND